MRTLLVASLLLLALTQTARAQHSGGQIGFEAVPIPNGTLDASVAGFSGSSGLQFAFGFGAYVDARLTPLITIGFAPRYTFNLKPDNSTGDAASELDLRGRVMVWIPLNPNLQFYGMAAPGYSIIFIPNNSNDNPKGLVLDFGAGLQIGLGNHAFLAGGVGYQLGFQGGSQSGVSYDFKISFFHVDLGIGTRF